MIETGKKWLHVVILIVIMLPLSAAATDDLPEVLPINPVPSNTEPTVLRQNSTGNFVFLQGLIERIEDQAMVISDTTKRLSPSVKYRSKYEYIDASPLKFQVGSFVGFELNEKREIIEIWLIE
jgi:hypothetical protein